MRKLKYYTVIGIFFVVTAGCLAHFMYDWSGQNPVVGMVTPVNESVWEHMKLLFFPMLVYSGLMVIRFKSQCTHIASKLCLGILTGTVLIPVLFYAYTFLLGRNILFIDIVIFVISVIAACGISYQRILTCKPEPYRVLLYVFTGILAICFIVFTYHPPVLQLFKTSLMTVSAGSGRSCVSFAFEERLKKV